MKAKTLDSANTKIGELELALAKAIEAKTKTKAHDVQPSSHHVSPSSANVQPDAVGAKAEELTLPPVTEETLEGAIRAESNWKVKWTLQRSLATLQTDRAVAEVKANKRSRK